MRITRNHIIGGSVVFSVFIIGALLAFYPTRARVLAEARESVERSTALFESSRLQYCEVYLAHLSSCYAGKQYNCDVLAEIQPEYYDIYGVDAPTDCGAIPQGAVVHEDGAIELMETETGIPEQEQEPLTYEEKTNPLFFGDEY